MQRRNFLMSIPTMFTAAKAYAGSEVTTSKKFNLKYAPHFGMFKHHAGERAVIDAYRYCDNFSEK